MSKISNLVRIWVLFHSAQVRTLPSFNVSTTTHAEVNTLGVADQRRAGFAGVDFIIISLLVSSLEMIYRFQHKNTVVSLNACKKFD